MDVSLSERAEKKRNYLIKDLLFSTHSAAVWDINHLEISFINPAVGLVHPTAGKLFCRLQQAALIITIIKI